MLYMGIFRENIAGDIREELSRTDPPLNAYVLDGNCLLVQIESPMTQYELGNRIGMSAHDRHGILFLLQGSYHGWWGGALTDWLESNHGAPVPLTER